MFTAGNEVKLFLDYSGKIYAAELVNGMAGNYAVVIEDVYKRQSPYRSKHF